MEEPRLDFTEYRTLIGVDSGPAIEVPADWGFEDDILNVTFRAIHAAMVEAMSKHGRPTRDPVRGAATLSEECGEVARAALDATREVLSVNDRFVALGGMYDELAQVAGYAFLLMISMGYRFKEMERDVKPA